MRYRKKRRIGLTGSTGFIGSALVDAFHRQGDHIIALDDLVRPRLRRQKIRVPKKLDWVLHFGATKSIEASFDNPIEMYMRNMNSTMAALDIAVANGARFLYMSSYVYGKPRYLPLDERHPTYVSNPYMGSKLLGEEMCCHLHQYMNLSTIILRGFTFYGPGQDDQQVIPSIINAIRNKKTINLKNANSIRDYLHVADLVRLVAIIVRSDCSGIGIYNVGGGIPYRNIEVARIANELGGSPVRINVEDKARRNDIHECYANISKVKKDFKWEPRIDLLSGLRDCLSA